VPELSLITDVVGLPVVVHADTGRKVLPFEPLMVIAVAVVTLIAT
jgi:hypothetical protein